MNSLDAKLQELENELNLANEEWVRLDATRHLLEKQLSEKEKALFEFQDTQDIYEKVCYKWMGRP